MNDWSEYKFASLAYFPPKISPPKNVPLPFIDMELVQPSRRYVTNKIEKKFGGSASKFENNDILFARITPCLENRKIAQAKISNTGFGSTEFFVFRAKENICDQGFLYYFSKSSYIVENAINSFVGASGRQRADAKFIKNLTIKIPSLPTQRKIAAILTAFDDLIENNNKRISILQNMAEQIYKEWFVRMRFPGYKKARFNKGIPEGWEVNSLSSIFSTSSGGTPSRKSEKYYRGHIPWIKTGELKNSFITKVGEHITLEALKNSSAKLFPKHAIVLALYGATIGQVGITCEETSTNQACCVFLPKYAFISYEYTFPLILSLKDYFLLVAFGGAQQNISQDIVNKTKIVLPSDFLIVAYTKLVKPMFTEIENLQNQQNTISRSRDLLIPRLLSGKISVEDLDIKVPPSMVNDDA